MEWRELIVDGYDRLPDLLEEVLAGLRVADLDWQPHRDCNSLGWTAWHLTRVQDSQIADLMGEEQLWIRAGRHAKFKRAADPEDTGYGDTPEQGGGSGLPASSSSSSTCGRSSSARGSSSLLSRPPILAGNSTSRGRNRGRPWAFES